MGSFNDLTVKQHAMMLCAHDVRVFAILENNQLNLLNSPDLKQRMIDAGLINEDNSFNTEEVQKFLG